MAWQGKKSSFTSIVVIVYCSSTAVVVVVVGDRAACAPEAVRYGGDSVKSPRATCPRQASSLGRPEIHRCTAIYIGITIDSVNNQHGMQKSTTTFTPCARDPKPSSRTQQRLRSKRPLTIQNTRTTRFGAAREPQARHRHVSDTRHANHRCERSESQPPLLLLLLLVCRIALCAAQ